MLEDLKVLNGILELKFNEYTYEYTVTVEKDIEALELEYKLKEDCYINVRNNILKQDESVVYIDVYNLDEEITYTLYVYKETTSEVLGIDNYKKSLEVSNSNTEVELYKVQLLTASVFLLILIVFSIIFKKKEM